MQNITIVSWPIAFEPMLMALCTVANVISSEYNCINGSPYQIHWIPYMFHAHFASANNQTNNNNQSKIKAAQRPCLLSTVDSMLF